MDDDLKQAIIEAPNGKQVLARTDYDEDLGWAYIGIGTTDDLKRLVRENERLKAEAERERQFICRKCGLREELGTKTEANF